MQALGPQILLGIGEEGGGPIFRTSSKASGANGLPGNSSSSSGAVEKRAGGV